MQLADYMNRGNMFDPMGGAIFPPGRTVGGTLGNITNPKKSSGTLGEMFAPDRSEGMFENMPVGTGMEQPEQPPARKPGFFADGGLGMRLAGVLGPALLASSGNTGLASTFINQAAQRRMAENKARQEQQQRTQEWQRQDELRAQDRWWEANRPQDFMSGRDRLRHAPPTGQSAVPYDGKEALEIYAGALGLEPGSDEYNRAMQDHVLRSSGPTAFGYDQQLDDYRTDNDIRADNARTRNRIQVRGSPTYRDNNPRPSSRPPKAPTAIGPNGEKVTWNGKAWVPAR